MTQRRATRIYTEEFKQQMVQLYNHGKKRSEIIREYELTPSALGQWIRRINASGSSKALNNRSEHELTLLQLQKENKRLKMEVDILKQAALLMGQK